jgi:hypothetical protein
VSSRDAQTESDEETQDAIEINIFDFAWLAFDGRNWSLKETFECCEMFGLMCLIDGSDLQAGRGFGLLWSVSLYMAPAGQIPTVKVLQPGFVSITRYRAVALHHFPSGEKLPKATLQQDRVANRYLLDALALHFPTHEGHAEIEEVVSVVATSVTC